MPFNPGNKRAQAARSGRSNSGSVLNNGGNMKFGSFPKIGKSYQFLRIVRCTKDTCGWRK